MGTRVLSEPGCFYPRGIVPQEIGRIKHHLLVKSGKKSLCWAGAGACAAIQSLLILHRYSFYLPAKMPPMKSASSLIDWMGVQVNGAQFLPMKHFSRAIASNLLACKTTAYGSEYREKVIP
jgi:hypothetical protein